MCVCFDGIMRMHVSKHGEFGTDIKYPTIIIDEKRKESDKKENEICGARIIGERVKKKEGIRDL